MGNTCKELQNTDIYKALQFSIYSSAQQLPPDSPQQIPYSQQSPQKYQDKFEQIPSKQMNSYLMPSTNCNSFPVQQLRKMKLQKSVAERNSQDESDEEDIRKPAKSCIENKQYFQIEEKAEQKQSRSRSSIEPKVGLIPTKSNICINEKTEQVFNSDSSEHVPSSNL